MKLIAYNRLFRMKVMPVMLLAFLALGNLVGAGILGLPNVTGIMGFVPTLFVLLVYCLGMLYTSFILVDETIDSGIKFFNYPSLYRKYLGETGKWIATAANLLILYGSMTAYIVGGTQIIVGLFHISGKTDLILILFFIILTGFTVKGFNFIRNFNGTLVILKWITFLSIVFFSLHHVEADNLRHMDLGFIPFALPVVVTVFTYHNIIPNICHGAYMNRKKIRKALLLGMCMGLAMNVIWCFVGIGVIPLHGGQASIVYIYKNSVPAIVPLNEILGWRYFLLVTLGFGMIGMFTAYMTQGMGLLGFSKDLLKTYFGIENRFLNMFVTFAPPLAVCLIDPDIFIKALGLIGTYGISVLFGILPGIISIIKPGATFFRKFAGCLIVAMFSVIIVIDILNKLGIISYRL